MKEGQKGVKGMYVRSRNRETRSSLAFLEDAIQEVFELRTEG